MKKIVLFNFLFFFTCSVLSETYTLENNSIFFQTNGKHITSLYDKKRCVQHIASSKDSVSFFALSYVDKTKFTPRKPAIDASKFTLSVLTHNENELKFKLEYTWKQSIINVKPHVTVIVKFVLSSNAEIISHINVELNNDSLVSGVDFPRFRTSRKLLNSNVSKLFVDPMYEGRMQSVETNWSKYTNFYPAKQGLQMSAILSDSAGVLLRTNDTVGHVKSFGFLNNSDNEISMAVRHCMPYDSRTWNASYQTMIGLCGNSWEDAAEVYRNWAINQSWSDTLLINRKAVPENYHKTPLVISSELYLEDNIYNLRVRLKCWAGKYKTNIIYRPIGWEKYGDWVGIDYLPTKNSDSKFEVLNSELKKVGIITAGFIESFHWTKYIEGNIKISENLEKYFNDNNGNELCRTQINESLYVYVHKVRTDNFLCRGTSRGQNLLPDVADGLFERGVTTIHNDADQFMCGNGPCYNTLHGHPVPYGRWETDTMIKTYKEIIKKAKTKNIENFSLTKEWPCEIYNMILSGYQARNWKIVSSEKNQIPLFVYVYHDYIPTIYGLCDANTSKDVEQCASIIYGQMNSIAFWNSTVQEPKSTDSVLIDYYESMNDTHAKDYLMYGRLLKSIVSSGTGAIHNTWKAQNESIAVFAIDTTESNVELSLKVPLKMYVLDLYKGKTLVSSVNVKPGDSYLWTIPKWRLCSAVFKKKTTSILKANQDSKILDSKNLDSKIQDSKIQDSKINVLLNRSEKILRVNSDETILQCEMNLYDMYGRVIASTKNESEMRLHKIPNGIYFLKIQSQSHADFVYKFVLF